ncbi:MAG: leucine-rich repeat protein [Bacilli bacterium]|nr:leucine-rich repeat protein [Bacilli bacterium]
MKKFSKLGFTLIELLAAIIIIAVIIAITVPIVFNIIEFVKREAFRATASSIADSGRLLIANENESQGYQEFYYRDGLEYNADGKKLDYSGKGPATGVVVLNEKNKVVMAIHNGTYCAIKSANVNTVTVTKTAPEECNAYSVIETCDTWEQIAIKYDVSLEDLLEANDETDPNSSTCNRDIKIPVESTSSGSDYVAGGSGGDESTVYYKTYYTVGYISSSSTLPLSYEYTIELGVLPLNISDIKTVNVTAKSVFESLEDFKRYIVKKNMGEVIWPGGDTTPLDISQASVLRDHAAKNTNMSSDNVSVTCNDVTCHAIVSATVDNLTNVNPNTIDGVGEVVYTPIKFTVEFNGGGVCPITPTPESCFVFNPDTNTITDYNYTTEGCPSDVSIPSTIGGVAVTTIGTSAFENNNLTCITFPSSVTTIGGSAFRGNSFTNLTIPSTITSIGSRAFANNQVGIDLNWNTNIDSVGSEYDTAFDGSYVQSLTFGASVTKIPSYILKSATLGVTEFTVPSSIISIGGESFYKSGLTKVTVPDNVTSVGTRAFAYNQLTGGVIWNANIDSVGNEYGTAFDGSYVQSLTFGASVTKIPSYILKSATLGVTEFTVPSSIVSIGRESFYKSGLTGVTISENATIIGSRAFEYNQLISVYIPNSVTSIGSYAFADNTTLTSVTINNVEGAVSIGTNAFGGVEPYYSP